MHLRKIRRANIPILIAWVLHVSAWLVPAVNIFGLRFQGWQAFLVSVRAFWPSTHSDFEGWYGWMLASVSAITTLLFVLGSPRIVLRGSRGLRGVSASVAAGAFVLNTHWYIFWGSKRSELTTGYFLWLLSFAVLAIGLFDLTRSEGTASIRATAVVPESCL
jgi:hypothetical protein